MPNDFLNDIVAYKKSLLKAKKAFFNEVKANAEAARLTPYGLFKKAISKPGKISLIAEIKKASPSRGIIRSDFDALQLARIYVDSGADALSVLTEDKYFLGKLSYVRDIQQNFHIPILFKDFIIDEAQIYEAFRYGASAVLLIVAILDRDTLIHFMEMARRFDMNTLVEVHNAQELETALSAGADIIGVNNRDLHTFEVDLQTARKLIPQIPSDRVIVVESGIKTHDEVVLFEALGAHAVLIGETFMRAPDVGRKMREIMKGEK